MLTLQELLNGVKCLDENTLAELSDKLWELGTLDDIKEKSTPILYSSVPRLNGFKKTSFSKIFLTHSLTFPVESAPDK